MSQFLEHDCLLPGSKNAEQDTHCKASDNLRDEYFRHQAGLGSSSTPVKQGDTVLPHSGDAAVPHSGDAAVPHSGDTASPKSDALGVPSLAIVDGSHASGISNVAKQLGVGLFDEVTEHPGRVALETAAVIGSTMLIASAGLAVPIALVGLGYVTYQLVHGDYNQLFGDFATTYAPQGHFKFEVDQAEAHVKEVGGDIPILVAGLKAWRWPRFGARHQ